MINPFRGYIKIKDKQPCQKFGNGEPLLTLEQARKCEEYGGVLNGEFTVKDVDDGDEANRLYRLVCDLNLNCRVYQTSRGKHFMFRSSEYCKKGPTRTRDAYGFSSDIRTGKNMYIVLKKQGKEREILRDFDENRPIDLFPKSFAPIESEAKFTGMGEGDGRNGALFKHSAVLLHCGFTPTEVKTILYRINQYAFDEPLSEEEMAKITRREALENYLERSTAEDDFGNPLKPKIQNDTGMADLFVSEYKEEVRYNRAIGWLVWNGKQWECNELKAQRRYTDFIKKVLEFAKNAVKTAYANLGDDAMADGADKANKDNEQLVKEAVGYYKYVNKMCDYSKIVAVMNCAKSKLEIEVPELDANAFELNTPGGIIDLKTGIVYAHRPDAFCTKMTKASPSDAGRELWEECLDSATQGNAAFKEFLQYVAGGMVIGKVYSESMFIAYGDGANGKSTVFNTIFEVLGGYAGKIPAEALTTRAKNAKVDLAELLGKRFVLASETEEGQRLSTSMLKQIASVDEISAEKKYHDPFSFIPTHTIVLYTNHLPRVGSNDKGTWRRLMVLPFNAVIANPQRDFAERLLKQSSGAVLKWAIEGAKKFIENNYSMPPCPMVDEANKKYKESNDWMSTFLDECCTVGKLEKAGGGVLYKTYREWATETGEYVRCNKDFCEALRLAGFELKHTKKGNEWLGLSLTPKGTAEEDFLPF
jgi:P4 family phage/plasmid primase-like protien